MLISLINDIAAVGSTTIKKELLRQAGNRHIGLKTLLNYAYDPYKSYYIKKLGPLPITGTEGLDHRFFLILDLLNSRHISGHEAKREVENYIGSLEPGSRELAIRTLLRDFKMGLNVKSINQVFLGLIPTFDVMLAQPIDWDRVVFPCYSSVKLDGVRGIYSKGQFYTRSGKLLQGLEHIADQLRGEHDIDGELMVRGTNFQVGCGNIRRKEASPNAFFCMFDLPNLTFPFKDRLNYLKTRKDTHLRFVKHIIIHNKQEGEAHYLACRAAGYEGTVIKPLDYVYERKRSYSWMKIKAIETEDIKVTGYYEGTGKYVGMLGGFIADFHGVSVRVGGGYSDRDRALFWRDPEKYVGRLMEVHFQEVTPDGSIRHSRFVRWRDTPDNPGVKI